MATLAYRNSLTVYRRYLQTIQNRPLLQASLFLIFSLTLVIILVASALRPTLITVAGLIGSLKEQKIIETRMNQKIQDLTHAQQILSEAQPRLSLIDEALPPKNKFQAWTMAVERLIATNKVQLIRVSVDETGKFSLAIAGSYPDMYRFLNDFQNLRRLSLIDNLQITKDKLIISGNLPYE